MSDPTPKLESPELEDQLKQILALGRPLPRHKHYKLMAMLDKLIVLQTRKLVTLTNLRDSIQSNYEKLGGW